MKTLRFLLAGIAAATALAFATSCSKTPAPEPFTAQLEDIDGAMFFVSMQHPKLVVQSINKLAAEIPEAAYINMMLSMQAGQFGFPEFAEIAAGSNIGAFLPVMTLDELKQGKTPPILVIKLREGGKIWNMLVDGAGMQTKKVGDWTMFAQNAAAFDAVKNPAAVTAKLDSPQAESLRFWTRLHGETAAACETVINDAIAKAIAGSKLPDAEKTAFTAYARVLFGEFFNSTHSGHFSLHLGDAALRMTFGTQFKPDTPAGIALRYRSDAAPTVGQYITNDALYSGVIRFTPKAVEDYNKHLTALILKVDYPPISESLAKLMRDSTDYFKQMDGCGALIMNMDMDLNMQNPQASKSTTDSFIVYSGKFDKRAMKYMRTSIDFVQQFIGQFTAIVRQSGMPTFPDITFSSKPNAATIEGINFDVMTTSITGGDINMQREYQYYGIADGNLVMASPEQTLKTRLPALLAKKPLPDNVAAANPLRPYDLANISINGPAITDLVAKIAKVDLADADNQAAFAGIKDSYKQAGPVRLLFEARQSNVVFAMEVPYKFISTSIALGRCVSSAQSAPPSASKIDEPPPPPARETTKTQKKSKSKTPKRAKQPAAPPAGEE